jgi:hypothetical protein
MELMDKIKSQASVLAEKAQVTAKAGQDRLSQMKSKRQADSLLLELGGLTYLSQTGRAQAGGDARAQEITTQLQTYEAEHGPISVTKAPAPPPASSSSVPTGSAASGSEAADPGPDGG